MRHALLASFALLALPGQAAALDLDLYARLLLQHTRETDDLARVRVDYASLSVSPEWKQLIRTLEQSDPAALDDTHEKLAFWANAYNILAIDLVARHYPLRSIKEIGSLLRPVWKRPAGTIAGRPYSLDDIEHGIVRPLGDPRAHVAVVCASLSCPPLLREPWRAPQLDAQLDAALRGWLADPRKGLRIDRARQTIQLSAIFDWFEEDFEARGGAVAFVTDYAPESHRAWLRTHGREASVHFLDYDWSLNALAE